MKNTTATALPIDDEWQSMDTAPLDRIVLLYRPTATKLAIQVAPGKYETNQYAKNPQPYWEVWLRIWNGVTESRAYPPTHWRDYPSPPLPTLELSHGSAALLAQPEPEGGWLLEGLTLDEELQQMLFDNYRGAIEFLCDTEEEAHLMIRSHVKFARAAIAADCARRPVAQPEPEGLTDDAMTAATQLAARPLLEKVARMADCIDQRTIGEIMAISDQAAAWLEANPPGQP
jgi:hypothetical protein